MSEKLLRSFGALNALLEQPRAAHRAVIGLLAVHTCLLAYSAFVHSPTLNEPGHLVAGLSYWKFGRFEIYRVNPPLVKMIAALPVIVFGYEEDWSGFYEGPGARPEIAMGEDFIAANGERSFLLFIIARLACIPFSWIGGIICYLWSRDLYGRPAGVMACTLWCFSPDILAHASLITSDAGGTALGIAACYSFWRWLNRPTWTQTALTGCVLGLAELTKTTLILLYPLWPLLWMLYRWPSRHYMSRKTWCQEGGMLFLRMIIGLCVVNLGYGFEGSFTRCKDFHFVSDLFCGRNIYEKINVPSGAITHVRPNTSYHSPKNRLANTIFGDLPIPLPKNYLIGIDIQQRDFEGHVRPSYLLGQWRNRGWWYYYLYGALIKIPLGTLLLTIIALLTHFAVAKSVKNRNHHQIGKNSACDTLCILIPPLAIFCVVSSKFAFTEHFRYILPCFPFLFILISRVVTLQTASEHDCRAAVSHPCSNRYNGISWWCHKNLHIVSLLLLLWSVVSSLSIYPHSLSYFNESIGGPLNGPKHMLGSNVDWGQDLVYSNEWLAENEALANSKVSFSVIGNPFNSRSISDGARHIKRDATEVYRNVYVMSVSYCTNPNDAPLVITYAMRGRLE